MKLRIFTVFACVLLATSILAAPADVPSAGTNAKKPGKCPSPAKCYKDYVSPPCSPGKLCSMVMVEVVACAWSCGQQPPRGCAERCQPCKAEVCIEMCKCEIVCASVNSCTATTQPHN